MRWLSRVQRPRPSAAPPTAGTRTRLFVHELEDRWVPAAAPAAASLVASAAPAAAYGPKQLLGRVNAPQIDEASGLAVSGTTPGVLWTHNDSGNTAQVFALSTSGKLLATYTLAGTRNVDWEDLQVGPGPVPGQSYLYLADVGNNKLNRSTVQIYRIPEPSVPNAGAPPATAADAPTVTLRGAERFDLRYTKPGSGGVLTFPRYNAETLLVDPRTGDVVIVGKSRNDVFSVPAAQLRAGAGTIDLTYVTTLTRGSTFTGGSVSADGATVAVKSHSSVYVWSRAAGQSLADVFRAAPAAPTSVSGPAGEAIALTPDGGGFYTLAEGVNQPLYFWPRNA
ncbi:hypothetical protein [Gemmata sp.]|uniref:hypothetical protein n=1 Tax=Gemmata sp. TaxID=1914242 RepID=UPI003F6FF64F